jgi:hypothetical protein
VGTAGAFQRGAASCVQVTSVSATFWHPKAFLDENKQAPDSRVLVIAIGAPIDALRFFASRSADPEYEVGCPLLAQSGNGHMGYTETRAAAIVC